MTHLVMDYLSEDNDVTKEQRYTIDALLLKSDDSLTIRLVSHTVVRCALGI